MSSSSDPQFQLEHVYPLGRDFPLEFAAIGRLKPVMQWVGDKSKDKLQLQLGAIVYLHRRRYGDDAYNGLAKQNYPVPPISARPRSSKKKLPTLELPYFELIREALAGLQDAVGSLENAANRLKFVDMPHWETISIVAKSIPSLEVEDFDALNVHRRLAGLMNFLAGLSISIQLGTGVTTSRKGKGRPGDNYLWAAMDLVELWKVISGKSVTTPRGTANAKNDQKEFTQPSTEFVRLALKMIDPHVTNSEVVTAIRGALLVQKKMDGQPPLKDALASLLKRL